MHWNDLIEKLIIEAGGSASLSLLYQNAPMYKRLPKGDWQKTLRGVLYREVKRGRFIKAGLGVYALPTLSIENSAYSSAAGEMNPRDFIANTKDPHSTIEGMLLELGNLYQFLTYTCDKNKLFDGKALGSLESMHGVPDFTYKELMDAVRRADVLWFSKRGTLVFPKYIYEVEHSTHFADSMVKMFQMRDFDARFILTSWESRRRLFDERVNIEPFVQIRNKFAFRSFEAVSELYFSAVKHFELEDKYFDQIGGNAIRRQTL